MEKIAKPPIEYISDWFDNLPKDLQERLTIEINFSIPHKFREGKDFFKDSIQIFKDFLFRKDVSLFEYVGHVVTTKALIDFFFADQATPEDWQKIQDKNLEELRRLTDVEYQKELNENLPDYLKYDSHFDEYTEKRVEALKKYLSNFEKDSITYIDAYEKWDKLCSNILTPIGIKDWKEKAFIASSLRKYK